ncbi:molecular chaperone DnaJ [archaeon]|nr:molecular chaperone DnaJ [archaeon]
MTNTDSDTELMHNKFCVIDHCNVITGSYNWSYKAKNNFENIVVTNNDTILAEQFIFEFNKIRQKYYPDSDLLIKDFPLNSIIKRLEILKNYMLLEDIEELERGILKLKEFDFNSDIEEIIQNIDKKEFTEAINRIQEFISKNQKLSIWIDPEIAALKLEMKNFENQITAFDTEKIELNKILSEFQHRHAIELGEIILDILKLRKIKFKEDKEKFKEAEKDEKDYGKSFDIEKGKEILSLNKEQKVELKKKYREATVLCHPDKFANESIDIQKQVEAIFKELNEANAKNDLKHVTEILEKLKKGILSTSKGDGLTDKDILRLTIDRLKMKLREIESAIIAIKESDTFQTIINIEDWDDYFYQTKEELKIELEELKIELNET